MVNVRIPGFLAAEKFAAGGQIEKQLTNFDSSCPGETRGFHARDFAAANDHLGGFAAMFSRSRVVRVSRLTLATLGRASPRKPMEVMA